VFNFTTLIIKENSIYHVRYLQTKQIICWVNLAAAHGKGN